jgi:hypothetical protein
VNSQSSSRLRSIAELPDDKAKASSGKLCSSSSFRLRSCFCGARLACEADLEHRAKATADKSAVAEVFPITRWQKQMGRCVHFQAVREPRPTNVG